jgi:hypothetical protein
LHAADTTQQLYVMFKCCMAPHTGLSMLACATRAVCGPDMCWCVRIVAYMLQAATDLNFTGTYEKYAHIFTAVQLGRI